jgi:spermidine synthase
MRQLYLLFFLSGFPALLYQIVWQRALFTIYGVNIESVSVVVAAFMLGLGVGSLIGGAISRRPNIAPIAVFGLAECVIGACGVVALPVFARVGTATLGATPLLTFLISFGLIVVPTILMGAALPLLVAHEVRRSTNVGRSIGALYSVNTLGSAVACIVAALGLLGTLGEHGAMAIAYVMNFLVGGAALAVYLGDRSPTARLAPGTSATSRESMPRQFWIALGLVAASGYLSLSYEILWVRVYSFLTASAAATFPLVLGSLLMGLAAGSWWGRQLCSARIPSVASPVNAAGWFLLFATSSGFLVIPVLEVSARYSARWTLTLLMVVVAAGALGVVLPLLAHATIPPDERTGLQISRLYIANIGGSVAGTVMTGLVLMDRWPLARMAVLLAMFGCVLSACVFWATTRSGRALAIRLTATVVVALVTMGLARLSFATLYERLQFKTLFTGERFAHVVETKSGVITVDRTGTVYGGGIFDGVFSTDLVHDRNGIVRPFALSLLHREPADVLQIGLSSGSWAQVLAHHPQLRHLTIVEINPGYLQLIPQYTDVRSLLTNPKIEIVIDDGRRWLAAHPDRTFDAIVMNTTWNWRNQTTNLLSVEFLQLVRAHLRLGGIHYFNTTDSDEAQRTAAATFPYAFRLLNFMVVSDRPIDLDRDSWLQTLQRYEIDGRRVIDVAHSEDAACLTHLRQLSERVAGPDVVGAKQFWLESRDSVLARTRRARIITDDNMGTEWTVPVPFPLPLWRLWPPRFDS